MRIKVYVAGPYSKGDVALNVRRAMDTADLLVDLGFVPFVPHLTHFWHMAFPRPYEFWLEYDNEFLPYCDALLRLPGESSGADAEVDVTKKWGIQVFHDIEDLEAAFPNRDLSLAQFRFKDDDEEGGPRLAPIR